MNYNVLNNSYLSNEHFIATVIVIRLLVDKKKIPKTEYEIPLKYVFLFFARLIWGWLESTFEGFSVCYFV